MPEASQTAIRAAPRSATVQSVDRACRVLDQIRARQGPMSAIEVAESIGLHRTIVHRLLRTLLKNGLVREESPGRYNLGHTALTMGLDYLDRLAIRRVALPYMIEIANSVLRKPWAVTLGVPVDDDVILVERVWTPSSSALDSLLDIGSHLPINHTAAGWCLLAYMDDSDAARRVGTVELEAMQPVLTEVRERQGLAFASNELTPGISAIAAPIFNNSNEPIAALIVSGPRLQAELRPDSELAEKLHRGANAITRNYAPSFTSRGAV